jgi:raffinose/stachyose/melibiose transport system substrate-binding protein
MMNTLFSKPKRIWRFILVFSLVPVAIQAVAKPAEMRITVWSIYQPGLDKVGDWIERKIKQFEKANPGIDIEHRFWDNQSYKIKLKVAMFSGEGPDIFYNWGGESQLMYSRLGLLYDLTGDLGKGKWGLSQGMFATHSHQDRIYGVPIFPTVEVVWYNKELFMKNGWKTPRTWDEFLALCGKVKAKGYIPVAMGGQEPWTILQAYMYLVDRVAGRERYFSAKARQASFTHPDFVEAFRLLRNLVQAEYLPRDVLSLNYTEATQLMIQNTALMMFMGDWEYGRLTNQMRENFELWDFFTFPVFPGKPGRPESIIGGVDGFSIKNSKNSKAAVKFLKFLASPENLTEVYRESGILVSLASPYMRKNDRPQIKGIAKLLSTASTLTQWWDQDLPEPVTQSLLRGLQDLLAGRISPEEAAVMLEEAYHK